MLIQRRSDYRRQVVGQYILAAHLQNTGTSRVGERQHRAKIEIVGEDDVIVRPRPVHDRTVRGTRVPDR